MNLGINIKRTDSELFTAERVSYRLCACGQEQQRELKSNLRTSRSQDMGTRFDELCGIVRLASVSKELRRGGFAGFPLDDCIIKS